PTTTYPLSLHDALPILVADGLIQPGQVAEEEADRLLVRPGDRLMDGQRLLIELCRRLALARHPVQLGQGDERRREVRVIGSAVLDRKSTRLNSSHVSIS